MKRFLLFLVTVISPAITYAATPYPQVSCSQYGVQANSCNQCFEGIRMYPSQTIGVTDLYDDFSNQSTNRIVMWKDDGASYEATVLQSGMSFFTSTNIFRFPTNFVFYTSSSGKNYHIFEP